MLFRLTPANAKRKAASWWCVQPSSILCIFQQLSLGAQDGGFDARALPEDLRAGPDYPEYGQSCALFLFVVLYSEIFPRLLQGRPEVPLAWLQSID